MPHVGLLMSFGVDLLLIGMCTLYAFKTRNLPENFNEAKFIGFTMYTTCVIWIAFVVLHLSTEKMVQVSTGECRCTVVSSGRVACTA